MSSKRKTTSLSQSSGSELSDAGKELELLAKKKQKKSYAYSRYYYDLVLFYQSVENTLLVMILNQVPNQDQDQIHQDQIQVGTQV